MSLIIFMDELDFLSSLVTRHPGRSLSPTSDYVLKILLTSQGVFNIIARSFGRGKKIISFQGRLSNLRAIYLPLRIFIGQHPVLKSPKVLIHPLLVNKIIMHSALKYLSIIQDQNLINILETSKAMSN